ncbi:MAG: hypothetical protein QM754_09725 [Tepidisphaeraceae bacterium]
MDYSPQRERASFFRRPVVWAVFSCLLSGIQAAWFYAWVMLVWSFYGDDPYTPTLLQQIVFGLLFAAPMLIAILLGIRSMVANSRLGAKVLGAIGVIGGVAWLTFFFTHFRGLLG